MKKIMQYLLLAAVVCSSAQAMDRVEDKSKKAEDKRIGKAADYYNKGQRVALLRLRSLTNKTVDEGAERSAQFNEEHGAVMHELMSAIQKTNADSAEHQNALAYLRSYATGWNEVFKQVNIEMIFSEMVKEGIMECSLSEADTIDIEYMVKVHRTMCELIPQLSVVETAQQVDALMTQHSQKQLAALQEKINRCFAYYMRLGRNFAKVVIPRLLGLKPEIHAITEEIKEEMNVDREYKKACDELFEMVMQLNTDNELYYYAWHALRELHKGLLAINLDDLEKLYQAMYAKLLPGSQKQVSCDLDFARYKAIIELATQLLSQDKTQAKNSIKVYVSKTEVGQKESSGPAQEN